MFWQTFVPTSITGWCSSALSFPESGPWLSEKMRATWERSSRDSGSMTWNSSSIPTVRLGRSMPHTLTAAPFIFSGQFPVSSMGFGLIARSMSMSATVRKIQSKFSWPIETKSQSGAGFMKSIA